MKKQGLWIPHKAGDYWLCKYDVDPVFQNVSSEPFFIGSDRTPLRFNNEKSARIKCDSLNKKDIM